jgi:thiamine-monophosphate kinase
MELDLIQWLSEQLPSSDRLRLGIGDDAAVLDWQQDRGLVVTTDLLVDRVHFDLASGVDPQRVGRKSLAVNLSDLAAMAAQPVGAVVSLALPRSGGLELAKSLFQGMLPLAEAFDCLIVGGDTNSHDGPLVVSVTAFGEPSASGVWTRSGAKPGDRLLVTGSLGGSLLGKHLDFTPRVSEALQLAQQYDVHAAMDISDGLSLDLARLAKQSNCGAKLIAADIPLSNDAQQASKHSGQLALEHALSDGEDFELLLAVSPSTAAKMLADQPLDLLLTDIGSITATPELLLIDKHGQSVPLKPTGYEHALDP